MDSSAQRLRKENQKKQKHAAHIIPPDYYFSTVKQHGCQMNIKEPPTEMKMQHDILCLV